MARSQRGLWHTARVPEPRLDWTRDEIMLAMDLYLSCCSFAGGSIPLKESNEVAGLSQLLKKLSAYPGEDQGEKYRKPDGVYLKLTNLRAIQTEGQQVRSAYSQLNAA